MNISQFLIFAHVQRRTAFFSGTLQARSFKHSMIIKLLGVYVFIVGLVILTLFQGHRCVRNMECKLCVLGSCLDSCPSSVQFSPLTDWVVGGTSLVLSIQQFYADRSVAQPPRCPEGWFWRGCRGVWHARTTRVSLSRQFPEEVPVDPQGSWSCSATSRWSYAPSRKRGEVSSCNWFWKPGSFFCTVSMQGPCFTAVDEEEGDKRLV